MDLSFLPPSREFTASTLQALNEAARTVRLRSQRTLRLATVPVLCGGLLVPTALPAAAAEAPPVPKATTNATVIKVAGRNTPVPAYDVFLQRDFIKSLPGALDTATGDGVETATAVACGTAQSFLGSKGAGAAGKLTKLQLRDLKNDLKKSVAGVACAKLADVIGTGALAQARRENKCLRIRLTPVKTADATDENPEFCRQTVNGSIGVEWMATGGQSGPLRWATSPAYTVPDASGTAYVQYFQGGLIAWRPGTAKAYSVQGLIAEKYKFMGAEKSVLGWPLSSEMAASGVPGRISVFEHGALSWIPGSSRAFEMHGAIWQHYSAKGREARFGLPSSDETGPVGGARSNSFTAGCAIVYTPGTRGALGIGTSDNCR